MLETTTKTLYQKPGFFPPQWSDPIRDELTLVEGRLRSKPEGQHDMLTGTIQGLFSAGGKRVRPSLSLLVSKLFDADIDHAVSIAAGVEMLHTATLVHDDLIDGSMLRRGAPTLNALWSADIAVLAGDYLFARAASMIAGVEVVPIMKLFAHTLETILNGEITQKFSKWEISRHAYEERIYAKTGALFVLSTHSAALLGAADRVEVDALIDFGRCIGMAFQIVDDVLDYTGTAEKMGKPIGGDLRQGLFTLPAITYAENHPQDADILSLVKLQVADPVTMDRVIRKIRESGALEASMGEAHAYFKQGERAIDHIPASIYKDSLLSLAAQIVDREN